MVAFAACRRRTKCQPVAEYSSYIRCVMRDKGVGERGGEGVVVRTLLRELESRVIFCGVMKGRGGGEWKGEGEGRGVVSEPLREYYVVTGDHSR